MTVTATSTPDDMVIDMADVRFRWPDTPSFEIHVDAFALRRGSRTLLLGPSGGGKSTLLSLMCGIVVPQTGRISVLGRDIKQLSSSARDRFRADHIGIIFQMFNLLPYGTVIDNVILPLSFSASRRARAYRSDNGASEAMRLLRALQLSDVQCRSTPATLSVGQQQRVAVARALIGAPEIIVADEPTSALDKERQAGFLDLLFEQIAAAGATLVMVSHDDTLAERFDQVLQLGDVVEHVSRG